MAPKKSKRSASEDDSTSDSGPDDVSFYSLPKNPNCSLDNMLLNHLITNSIII